MLVEGAGSASEINLRGGDIANMGFARAAGAPVVLVGDIDRGGVIASLVGTQAVLDPDDAAMIAASSSTACAATRRCSTTACARSRARTGWPALGLVPHFADAAACRPRMRPTWRRLAARRRDAAIAVPLLP